MTIKSRKSKAIIVMACLFFASGTLTIRAERNISSVAWPIIVNLSNMDFGQVSGGEELEKTFTVSYSGKGDGGYAVVEKYKPRNGAKVPSGYDGTIGEYCQTNHEDEVRCLKNLCPFIEEESAENEGDTVDEASVSASDRKDVWKVILNTPTVGGIKQDGQGGVVSEGGDYGCDLSFTVASVPSEPVCGNALKEKDEACDDGNNKSGDGCSASCQIESCVNNREVCDGNDNNCDGEIDNVFEVETFAKVPDQVFLSDGKTSNTSKVTSKDDGWCALMKADGTEYIYMNWEIDNPEDSVIGSAKVNIKHKEGDAGVVLEAWNGSGYVEVCDLGESERNNEEECSLDSVYKGADTGNIKLRMKIEGGNSANSCLDWAYLNVEYKKAVACSECGNGKIEMDEQCDDGNSNDSDSCSNSCTRNRGSISGCKYEDDNANGRADAGEDTLGGFEIKLVSCPFAVINDESVDFLPFKLLGGNDFTGACHTVKTVTTGSDGCYVFAGLKSGNYGVGEKYTDGWAQTYPKDGYFYYVSLGAGQCKEGIDFLGRRTKKPVCGNDIVEKGEECDDGNEKGGDGCSCICTDEDEDDAEELLIKDAKANEVTESTAEFMWTTNYASDSRVVCSKHSHDGIGRAPDYGYTFSSSTFDIDYKLKNHNITIYELEADTDYHCRVISSRGNDEAVSDEISFTTEAAEEDNAVEETSLYIHDLTLEGLYKDRVDLAWKTNREGTTCVVYSKASHSLGDAPSYGYDWMTAGCENTDETAKSHSVTIEALEPCTTYYFRLTSTNCENDAVTVEQEVRTMCAETSVYYPRIYVPSTSCGGGEKGGSVPSEGASTTGGSGNGGAVDGANGSNGQTNGGDDANIEDCPDCEDTVRTVIETERYMNTQDWAILFLLLMVIFLAANKLINKNRAMKGTEPDSDIDEE